MWRGVKPSSTQPKFVAQVYGKALKAKQIDSKYGGVVCIIVTTIQDFHLTNNNIVFQCIDTKEACADIFDVGVTVRKRKCNLPWWAIFFYKIFLYKLVIATLVEHGIISSEEHALLDYLNILLIARINKFWRIL